MKKSLFAIAAVTAFAGAAQAQSSVTVYGILDVGFRGQTTTVNNVKTNTTSFSGTGSETTSRLGFRGTEDLGGGTSAFFTAEFQLYPTDPQLSGSGTNLGGLVNRQTFLGLAQKGIGRAAIGTQYTPIHLAISRNDAGQQNNMFGDVIYAPTDTQGAAIGSAAYTVRQFNALTASTERLAGFTISGMYVNNNRSTNATTPSTEVTTNNNQGYALAVNYVWKKLNVDAVYQSFKSENATVAGRTAAGLPSAFNATGTNITDTQMYAGAVYDFGILKAYAQYIDRKATSGVNSNNYLDRSAQQIGVRGNITPKIEPWAMIGNGSFKSFGTGGPTLNFTGWQVGSNYILSKRTNLYAIYGAQQSSSGNTGAVRTPSASGSTYGVGLRHTF
jgi:predicted porin